MSSPKLSSDVDPALILACPLQRNLHIPLLHEPRKLFSPLDQQDAVFGAQIIQSERFEFALRVDAIEIDMEKIGARSTVFVDEREGGAGDILFGGCIERSGDSLDQRGLTRAEIAAQEDEFGRSEKFCERSAEGDGFFGRMRGDFLG